MESLLSLRACIATMNQPCLLPLLQWRRGPGRGGRWNLVTPPRGLLVGVGVFLGFGAWDLGFLWSLEFGIWSFPSAVHGELIVRKGPLQFLRLSTINYKAINLPIRAPAVCSETRLLYCSSMGKKILFVDDEPEWRLIPGIALTDAGYEVITAKDVFETGLQTYGVKL